MDTWSPSPCPLLLGTQGWPRGRKCVPGFMHNCLRPQVTGLAITAPERESGPRDTRGSARGRTAGVCALLCDLNCRCEQQTEEGERQEGSSSSLVGRGSEVSGG